MTLNSLGKQVQTTSANKHECQIPVVFLCSEDNIDGKQYSWSVSFCTDIACILCGRFFKISVSFLPSYMHLSIWRQKSDQLHISLQRKDYLEKNTCWHKEQSPVSYSESTAHLSIHLRHSKHSELLGRWIKQRK